MANIQLAIRGIELLNHLVDEFINFSIEAERASIVRK